MKRTTGKTGKTDSVAAGRKSVKKATTKATGAGTTRTAMWGTTKRAGTGTSKTTVVKAAPKKRTTRSKVTPKSVLVSIRPEFIELIFAGKKKFEYRTKVTKDPITRLVIYAPLPVQRIVAVAEVDKTYPPGTKEPDCYAIHLAKVHRLSKPPRLQEAFPRFRTPPQWIFALEEAEVDALLKKFG